MRHGKGTYGEPEVVAFEDLELGVDAKQVAKHAAEQNHVEERVQEEDATIRNVVTDAVEGLAWVDRLLALARVKEESSV